MEKKLQRILDLHCQRYPRLQVVDLYKLLHQASMGSEHAVTDEAGVRSWLEAELATMAAGPQEPLIDHIHPSGEIVRVHLRPYVQAGHDPEALLVAFVQTAANYRGSVDQLEQSCTAAAELASAGRLPFQPEQIVGFMGRMAQQNFPAAHHSAIYGRLYKPAYRVVARTFLGSTIVV